MGVRNYLIEGASGTGKTSVCHELRRRGYHALNGDRDLAYKGDPKTGEPMEWPAHQSEADRVAWVHEHHIWDVGQVRTIVADQSNAVSFLCGGSRNFACFVDLFDAVFVLDIDLDTLKRRLAKRPDDEFGGTPSERELILRLHAAKNDIPTDCVVIDATPPLANVVDAILAKCG